MLEQGFEASQALARAGNNVIFFWNTRTLGPSLLSRGPIQSGTVITMTGKDHQDLCLFLYVKEIWREVIQSNR